MQFTVHSLVNDYVFFKYLAVCTWKMDADTLVQEVAQLVHRKLTEVLSSPGPSGGGGTDFGSTIAPTQPALIHSASTPARIGIQPPVSSPGRDVAAAWALLSDDKCVMAGDKDRLSQLLDDLGVESALHLESLLNEEDWEKDLEPVIACLKKGMKGVFRKYLGLS